MRACPGVRLLPLLAAASSFGLLGRHWLPCQHEECGCDEQQDATERHTQTYSYTASASSSMLYSHRTCLTPYCQKIWQSAGNCCLMNAAVWKAAASSRQSLGAHIRVFIMRVSMPKLEEFTMSADCPLSAGPLLAGFGSLLLGAPAPPWPIAFLAANLRLRALLGSAGMCLSCFGAPQCCPALHGRMRCMSMQDYYATLPGCEPLQGQHCICIEHSS